MSEEKRRTGLFVPQNVVVTTIIALFFLGVVISYHAMLSAETRDNIIKNGELAAVNAASRLNEHIDTGVDAIELTGYTLDNMIRDNRSNEDILDFLVDQSYAMKNVVYGQTNGVYGYINGEYLDGSLWTPDADFNPTERPWYVTAIANAGKAVIVDPYVDTHSGSRMLTISKTLCDAKSVVAIDINLRQLQAETELIAQTSTSDMEIILNRNYQVVAHSDPDEVGKDYFKNDDTFGSAIVEALRQQESDRSSFSVRYEGTEYIIYAITIESDWVCLSVSNASAAFLRLHITLMITIVVGILILAVILAVMIRYRRKDELVKEMTLIADQQTQYAHVDQLTGLKNRRAFTEAVEQLDRELPQDCILIAFDVNGLKETNDTLGHEAGDELIVATAECIRASFEEIDKIYRLGGDEFCVILNGTREQAEQRLEDVAHRTADWEGRAIGGFTVSAGIAEAKDCPDIYDMQREADRNMYACKNAYYETTKRERRGSDR